MEEAKIIVQEYEAIFKQLTCIRLLRIGKRLQRDLYCLVQGQRFSLRPELGLARLI
jgi:hypothetical protein